MGGHVWTETSGTVGIDSAGTVVSGTNARALAVRQSSAHGQRVRPFTSPYTCHFGKYNATSTCFQITGPNGTNCVSRFYAQFNMFAGDQTILIDINGPSPFGHHYSYPWLTVYQGQARWLQLTFNPPGSCADEPVGTYCGVTWDYGWYLDSSACNTVHT